MKARRILSILMSLVMVFTMMPMMGQTAYAYTATIELDGGSYTLAGDNLLVKDGTSGEEINIHSDQDITFKGNTVIKLNGNELKCASIKSGFENPSDPDIGKHPWYSYDLTIDGGDEGGSIQIGDPNMEDYAVAAYNLTIQNLSADSEVSCLRESGNKVAIFAKNDLRIEGIKRNLDICGAAGTEARDGKTIISDVSGLMQVAAMRCGIDTDDTNKNTIKISSSNVVIDVQGWDGNCINSGWKKGGISITDSIVRMSNSNNGEPTSTSKGGYNALSASEIVNIKDSYVTAENRQKDRPAMLVYEDTGKLIISGESMLVCQNVEGGSASALMTNAIELKDGNRLFMPKDGYIGKTKYNGGGGEKEMYTVLDKDGNNTNKVGFGSGKEVINTVSAPAKVLVDTPIHMSGVLKDEDGDPVPNAMLSIECNHTSVEEVMTNAQGIWEYKGDRFNFSDPGEVTLEIHFGAIASEGTPSIKDLVRYLPQEEGTSVKVQVISGDYVETLEKLKLTDPPEGASRKTEYKCGEGFDLDSAYVQAIIVKKYADGRTESEARPLDPRATTITPSVLKHGTEKVSISYMFEGERASIDYPVTVSHDWNTEWRKDGDKHWHECSGCHEKKDEADHTWDAGVVTKPATTTETGVKTCTCMTCKTTKADTISKLIDPVTQVGEGGSAIGAGASAQAADKAITTSKSEEGPKGSKFALLQLKSTSQGKNNIKLSWKKPKGATKFVVYGNACGTKNKMKKIATVKGTSYNVKKISGKALKQGTYYKYMVMSLNAQNKVVSTSKVVHVATKGGKVKNYTGVTVQSKVIKNAKKLRVGKSLKLGAKTKGSKVKKHRGAAYESSNPKIATVITKGVVKGVSKGTCYIYVYTQNGISKKVKFTVK